MFNVSHYSFQSVSTPEKLVNKYKEYGYKSCILVDNNLCGVVDFIKNCNKLEIKPIIGVSYDGRLVLCKNKTGYYDLVKALNRSISFSDFIKCKDVDSSNCIIIGPEGIPFEDVTYHITRYTNKREQEDYDLMTCSASKLTLKDFETVEVDHNILSPSELKSKFTKDQIRRTKEIIDECEPIDLKSQPTLPKFCSGSEIAIIKELCIEGWKKRSKNWGDNYKNRIKFELGVIENNGLSGYFLIVQDFVNWCKKQGWLIGSGRGSASGCLVSYLLGITEVDPIKYNLKFERFFNPARKNSLPDIDIDFPTDKREKVIEYIRNKYGHDKVAQISTYGSLKGRAALKEVLRIHNVMTFEQINKVTEFIPDEAKIVDKMEEAEETSILNWILDNEPQILNSICRKVDGKLCGDYARYVEQAIRLEGVYKSRGKHAAGIIISNDVLRDIAPMVKDKSNDEFIVGFDLNDSEYVGLVKFDILGLAALDKLSEVRECLTRI